MLTRRNIPRQDSSLVQVLAERYQRAVDGMTAWANRAKECVEMTEANRDGLRTQWSADALRKLNDEDRPAFSFNKIAPLVRLVLGYHRNNRIDTKYLPGHDGSGTDDVAESLTHLAKNTSELSQEPFVDGEVMMDGTITGRGYYDVRLDYENNQLGEAIVTAKDPFSIKVDPELSEYDLNKGTFIAEDRWASIDEIAFWYGASAEALLNPLLNRSGVSGMPSQNFMEWMGEVTPWRTFGGGQQLGPLIGMADYTMQSYDPYRKTIRLIDFQHYVRVMTRCFIDLETGDVEKIPDRWTDGQITKVLAWAEDQYAQKGKLSPLRVRVMPMRRVRWTTLAGDIVVYDQWSQYETFTMVGYFPWFRRGMTRGMVEDLIDPQNEVNKRRSANIDIVTRTANSGWQYHKDSLSPDEKDRLEVEGAAPGYNQEWQGENKPTKIESGTPPMAFERLETKAADDLKEISGVNDSLLGQIDKVQSGRAIEARQRQGVISIQTYMDNNSRSKELVGRKKLEIYQNHYTEQRLVRVLGDNGNLIETTINKNIEATNTILNDVTIGKYRVVVDETPLSASFLSAQFDEIMMMIEKGVLPAQVYGDMAIDASSMPRKEEAKQRWQAMQQSMGIPVDPASGAAPGAAPMAGPGQAPPSIVDAGGQPVQSMTTLPKKAIA